MQSVNGAQVLNITSLSLLSGSHTIYLVNASRALSPLLTVMVPLRSIHASQYGYWYYTLNLDHYLM